MPRAGREGLPIARLFIDRHPRTGIAVIATGVAAGCAGGSAAVAGAAGDGFDGIRRR